VALACSAAASIDEGARELRFNACARVRVDDVSTLWLRLIGADRAEVQRPSTPES
jgi:hypothetical protein